VKQYQEYLFGSAIRLDENNLNDDQLDQLVLYEFKINHTAENRN
jgi:hypothetical protein